ncbi:MULTISPECIES: hypothetical protein [unclassified Marinovum]
MKGDVMLDRRGFLMGTVAGAVLGPGAVSAQGSELDRTIAFYARSASDKGLRFLRTHQTAKGGWPGGDTGLISLGLRAFLTSYQGYGPADGPFVTKPLDLISKALAGAAHTAVDARSMALAISALREVHPSDSPILADARAGLVRGYDVDFSRTVAAQIDAFFFLEALRGDDTSKTETLRQTIRAALEEVQLASGAFPDASGQPRLDLSAAGLHALQSSGAERASQGVTAAVDWIVSNYSADMIAGGTGDIPAGFSAMAVQAGMIRVERLYARDALGSAVNWRDTLVYGLLAGQAEDGGWSPELAMTQRVLSTALTVIVLNSAVA